MAAKKAGSKKKAENAKVAGAASKQEAPKKEAAQKEAPKKEQGAKQGGGPLGKITEFKEYFQESQAEMKKVTWPSRQETVATGIAVLVLVVVMSIYLGVVDYAFSKAVEAILS
jgi:preprotein translocase subunit SecE